MFTRQEACSFQSSPPPAHALLILLTSANQPVRIHLFLQLLKTPPLSLCLIALHLFLLFPLPCLLSHTPRFLRFTCSPSALTRSHLFAQSINFTVNTPGRCCQSVQQRAVLWKTNCETDWSDVRFVFPEHFLRQLYVWPLCSK
jgi:hypothetical protein